jgi:hypothetical protein
MKVWLSPLLSLAQKAGKLVPAYSSSTQVQVRQEDSKFQDSLGYETLSQKTNKCSRVLGGSHL